jgi:hypothetical protein
LPAADAEGTSDPCVRIVDCGSTQETIPIFETLNPIWYETLEMGYEANELCDMPPIIADLFDVDISAIGTQSYDFLTRCLLKVEDMESYSEDNRVPTPSWYSCKQSPDGDHVGDILMSFAVVEDDFTFRHRVKRMNLIREVGIKMRDF